MNLLVNHLYADMMRLKLIKLLNKTGGLKNFSIRYVVLQYSKMLLWKYNRHICMMTSHIVVWEHSNDM